ncbi:GapA-binding peptide SR1P [Neobacillus mesonae]|uniref:GapA-binding peptide SR1P n=1 Tax=Neobacillus mesonae TaxID=1193713 RepID=UPI00203B51BB|nr:GapA-binding peptide SR1P [Neobacillus mesonae]MCM3571017.1 GapA-binding peptide SR1P [Neobacillus mesonae]
MEEQVTVKQCIIVCQECDKIIDVVESTEGVKTLYGICRDCSDGKHEEHSSASSKEL